MDLSYWTSLNLKHSIKNTNKLFYGEYRYCASGELDYAKLLRGFDKETLDYRISAQKNIDKSVGIFGTYFGYQYRYNRKKVTIETSNNLHNFLTILQEFKNDFKIVLSWHNFYVYSNCVNIIKDVLTADGVIKSIVTEANISHPPNTIVRKSSKYQYRCYLKNTIMSVETHNNIRKFFNVYGDLVSISKTFSDWLDKEYKYCKDYFFFDYNDPGLELIFEMTAPGMIKNTYKVITQDLNTNG